MRRVVFNQKGGVGKSTLASNLAAISAHLGFKTLLLDLDPQGNSTQYVMGRDFDGGDNHVAALLEQALNFKLRPKTTAEFVVQSPIQNLSVLPSHPSLDELQTKLEQRYKIYKLREALDELQDEFDRIYIDTPPLLNFYARSALIAAQQVLVPFDCDEFARQALYKLMDALQEIRDDHNPSLQLGAVVVNQFQARAGLPIRLIEQLKSEGLPVLPTAISSSVKVRESHDAGQPMIVYMPSHKVTQELIKAHTEIEALHKKSKKLAA